MQASIKNVLKGLREGWVARYSFSTTLLASSDEPEVVSKTTRVSRGACGIFLQAFLPHVNSAIVVGRSLQWACVPSRCLRISHDTINHS